MDVDVRTDIVIERPIGEVSAYASEPENAPSWYANIASAQWQTTPPLAVGSRFAFVASFLGRRLAYIYEVVELDPEHRLVMRTDEGPFPMETTYTWEADGADRTRMTLQNRGTPAGFASVTAPVLAQAMRRANVKDLARLKAVLEAPPARGDW